jgi:hypothetical protein
VERTSHRIYYACSLDGESRVFGWLKRQRSEEAPRPETPILRFDNVEPVRPSPKFGNTGPQGWGFTLWGLPDGEEYMYRYLLEKFAKQHPEAYLDLPAWYDREDLIEGSIIWHSQYVWVWYETVLTHIWVWSADEEAIESLRKAILPLVKAG